MWIHLKVRQYLNFSYKYWRSQKDLFSSVNRYIWTVSNSSYHGVIPGQTILVKHVNNQMYSIEDGCHSSPHIAGKLFQLIFFIEYLKVVRALRGKFGPLLRRKLKVAFHENPPTGLLEE